MSSESMFKKKRVLIPAAFLAISTALTACGASTTETADTASESKAPAAAPATKAPAKKPAAKPAAPAITTSAKEMIAVLEGNALKAKNTYEDKQVTVTGFVGNIDASGKYFSLLPEKGAIIFTGVNIDTGKKFADQIANLTADQPVTVTGKVTDVGEVGGYRIKAVTIK
jgi:hypothetical protein